MENSNVKYAMILLRIHCFSKPTIVSVYDPQTKQISLELTPVPTLRCSVILPHLQQSQPLLK
jgi:hypothetical protein